MRHLMGEREARRLSGGYLEFFEERKFYCYTCKIVIYSAKSLNYEPHLLEVVG